MSGLDGLGWPTEPQPQPIPSRRYTCQVCGRKGRRSNSISERKRTPICPVCTRNRSALCALCGIVRAYSHPLIDDEFLYGVGEGSRIDRVPVAVKNGGFKKQSITEKMLGCSFKQFTKHIELHFTDGMSWDNRADWHLDHILPLSCATTIEGLEKLSHYTNIRPLWAADNMAKCNNLVLL